VTQRCFTVYGTASSADLGECDPLQRVAKLAIRAEQYGIDGLLVFYNHRDFDPWAIAGVILQHTMSVTPLVAMQPYSLPPFTAAKLIRTMARLYQRRVDVNLITGAAKEELGQIGESLDHDERYERAIEYASIVRSLLSAEGPVAHQGKFFDYPGLRMNTWLDPEERPRIFVAGSSPAARRAALAVGDVVVTHPEPVDQFAVTFLGPAGEADGATRRLGIGIRIGMIARETDKAAWAYAEELYPSDRRSLLKASMRRRSESDWSRRMAALAGQDEAYDDVYWTGAFRADKGSMPLLVGSYARVTDYLGRYLDLGVDTLLLGGDITEDDFSHTARVLADLRDRAVG
jgi:alkanesulfonate monooxygenase